MENVVASDTHHLVTRSVCTTSARNIQDDFLHSTGISVQENARNALLPLRVEGEVVGIREYNKGEFSDNFDCCTWPNFNKTLNLKVNVCCFFFALPYFTSLVRGTVLLRQSLQWIRESVLFIWCRPIQFTLH